MRVLPSPLLLCSQTLCVLDTSLNPNTGLKRALRIRNPHHHLTWLVLAVPPPAGGKQSIRPAGSEDAGTQPRDKHPACRELPIRRPVLHATAAAPSLQGTPHRRV